MEIGSISGGWIVERVLGSSNKHTTAVWKRRAGGTAAPTPEQLVVKMCRLPPEGLTERQRHSWRDHLSMLYKINHENIVKILNLPTDLTVNLAPHNLSGLPVLCMEYCDVGDLRSLLSKPENCRGLDELSVRTILFDIKNAVDYLQNLRIVHKDLRPEGIALFSPKNPSERPFVCKLTDLGMTKDLDGSLASTSSQYSAPELIYSKSCSKTADFWSLGLIAFEIICGTRPFLPNMAPVQWMTHVKTKSHQHICIFENVDGKIEYTNTLLEENRMSGSFRTLIEKWLYSALEWDPEKRGLIDEHGKETSPSDNDNFLKYLNYILSKKILTIFSVSTYEILSYEIDENTLFPTLKGWIEHDTKININDQTFLSPNINTVIDTSNYVFNVWNPRSEIMLYLYQKNTTINDNIKLQTSSKIHKYLEKPKMVMSNSHLTKAFVEIYNFISNEHHLYNLLSKSSIAKLELIKNEIKTLNDHFNKSEKEICKLNEKFILLSAIVKSDKAHADSMKNSSTNIFVKRIETWLGSVKPIHENITKLKDAWIQLTTRLESVTRRCNSVYDNDAYWKKNISELSHLESASLQLITTMKSLSKEEKSRDKTCIDGVKLLYKCFKLRDLLIFGTENKKFIQKILDIDIEVQKMGTLISSAGKNAVILSNGISVLMMDKENLVWKTFKEIGSNSTDCSSENNREAKTSIDFKIGEPVRSPVSVNVPDTNVELISLINDSKKLCMISEDFISRSYKKNKIIQEELLTNLNSFKIDDIQ